jgi:hypothetical protein
VNSSRVGRVLVLVLVAVAFVAALLSNNHEAQQRPKQTTSPSASPSPTPTSDPESLKRDRTILDERLEAFCQVFYSRNPSYDPAKAKALTREFATDNFMQANDAWWRDDSEADIGLARERASLTVKAEDLGGEFDESDSILIPVRLMFVKRKADGRIESQYTLDQSMYWLKDAQGTWRIDALSDTS